MAHTKLMLSSRDKDNNESTSEISEDVSCQSIQSYHLFLYPINIDFTMNEFRIWNWDFDSLLFCSQRIKVGYVKSFSTVFFVFHMNFIALVKKPLPYSSSTFFMLFCCWNFSKMEFMIDSNAPKVKYFQMLKEWFNVKHSFDGLLCKVKNKFKNI